MYSCPGGAGPEVFARKAMENEAEFGHHLKETEAAESDDAGDPESRVPKATADAIAIDSRLLADIVDGFEDQGKLG